MCSQDWEPVIYAETWGVSQNWPGKEFRGDVVAPQDRKKCILDGCKKAHLLDTFYERFSWDKNSSMYKAAFHTFYLASGIRNPPKPMAGHKSNYRSSHRHHSSKRCSGLRDTGYRPSWILTTSCRRAGAINSFLLRHILWQTCSVTLWDRVITATMLINKTLLSPVEASCWYLFAVGTVSALDWFAGNGGACHSCP